MKMYLSFNHDEIQWELPYAIIGETASRPVWNTGRRKRLWAQTFTESERKSCNAIINKAKRGLLVTGCPEEVKMTVSTYHLWHRLANFCVAL